MLNKASIGGVIAAAIFVGMVSRGVAVQDKPAGAAPKLEDIAWLAGAWSGEAGGMLTEEQWMTPHAGCMLGMCRMSRGGKLFLSEFLTIEEREAGVELRIHHFKAGMERREEKPFVWRLASTADKQAVFELVGEGRVKKLVYAQPAAGEIACTLFIEENGQKREEHFRMSRAGKKP
jgi:Domain of unknown function (DUF6265)